MTGEPSNVDWPTCRNWTNVPGASGIGRTVLFARPVSWVRGGSGWPTTHWPHAKFAGCSTKVVVIDSRLGVAGARMIALNP